MGFAYPQGEMVLPLFFGRLAGQKNGKNGTGNNVFSKGDHHAENEQKEEARNELIYQFSRENRAQQIMQGLWQ